MPSNHLILCHPLLLLPSIFPTIRVFSNESALRIRWPKYWSFSFNINPSNEYSVLISFRIDWFDLLAVQGTLESLLQHHSSKASVLQHSVFFMVQLLPSMNLTLGQILAALQQPTPFILYFIATAPKDSPFLLTTTPRVILSFDTLSRRGSERDSRAHEVTQETVKDKEAWHAATHGVTKSQS